MSQIFPIGYTAHGSGQRISQLMYNPKTLIMDCRVVPWSQQVEWRSETLGQQWNSRYHYAGGFLGNSLHKRNKHNRAKHIGEHPYRNEVKLIDPVKGIAGLMQYLREGHDLILLCSCWDYHNCHLEEVVRLLKMAMPEVEVVLQNESLDKVSG